MLVKEISQREQWRWGVGRRRSWKTQAKIMRERERERRVDVQKERKLSQRERIRDERLNDTKIDKDGKIKKKTLCLPSTKHPEVRHPCVCSYTHTRAHTRTHAQAVTF